MNISPQEQCRWVPLLSPSWVQSRPWNRDQHVAISSLHPHRLLAIFAKTVPRFPGRDEASRASWLSQGFPRMIATVQKAVPCQVWGWSSPPWSHGHGRGSTEQEVVPFPTKRSRWRQEGPIFPCAPPLSPQTRPGMLRGSRWGFRACSHVLPAPPSRACRGRSRHAPAVLGRRKQIGFPAGVQGAGRPWLVSHHRSVGMGCGERPGSAGMEGADLAEGSLRAVESLWEGGHDIGLTKSRGCCLCLSLMLRWACSLGGGRCCCTAPKPLPDPFMGSC